MAKKSVLASKSTLKSLVPYSLFGPPPVLKSEDLAAYDGLLAHVSKCVKPKDILEKIWIRDAVVNVGGFSLAQIDHKLARVEVAFRLY